MDATQASAAASAVQTVSDKFANNASEALALLITKVTSGIDQASDFLVAQVPDVIHQLLIYNLVSSLALCAAGFIGILVSFWAARWIFCHCKDGLQTEDRVAFTALTAIGGTAMFGTVMAYHFDWLKIWLAPKIWLIEYSVHLIKTTSGH